MLGYDMTGYDICETVNKIIEELRDDKDAKEYPVNWGDISVNEVSIKKVIYPGEYMEMQVTISEASPDAYDFCERISTLFQEKHGFFITVISEW